MAVDPMEFRRTVGCFATGVTVITATDGDGIPRGLTANAFSSLSLDPLLILICVDHKSTTFPTLSQVGAFAVNVLDETQKDLSQRFAGKSEDKFVGVEFHFGRTGAPILSGSLAVLECTKTEAYVAGDHTIF